MKQFLIQFVRFFGFALVFYLCMLVVWGQLMPYRLKPNLTSVRPTYGFLEKRLDEIDRRDSIDLLFLGSSHAYRGFDTRIFEKAGYKVFNLGSSAQTPVQTLLLLQRYLDKLHPDTVIYEVYPSTFFSDGVESSIDVLLNDKNDVYSLQMAFSIGHLLTYNTLLYASICDFFGIKMNNDAFKSSKEDIYVPGGFVERVSDNINKGTGAQKTHQAYQPIQINMRPYELHAFEKSLQLLAERDVEVILIFAPVTSGLYRRYENVQEFDSLMREYGTYYNFNGNVALNDTVHFYDHNHLNQSGVELFNREVLKVLKNH